MSNLRNSLDLVRGRIRGRGVRGQKSFENQLWSVSKDTGKNLKEKNSGLLLSFTHSINLYFGPIACQALGPLQALS